MIRSFCPERAGLRGEGVRVAADRNACQEEPRSFRDDNMTGLEGGDHVAINALPMNLRREIREGFVRALVEAYRDRHRAKTCDRKKSSENSSSNRCQFPLLCTSSVLRRTADLAVSPSVHGVQTFHNSAEGQAGTDD